jgi:hypothetical protein
METEEIAAADVILLLVSRSFIASPYCQNELLRAIELRGTSKSLPIPKSTNLTTPIASRLVAR